MTTQLSEIGPDECRRLLADHHVGRLAFADRLREFPMIIPVNYAFVGGAVVIRSGGGSKFRAAVHNSPAAFEIDGIDEGNRTGWSVVARGRVEEVSDPDQLAELGNTPLVTWAPGDRPHVLRLTPRHLTGRRISIADLPATWWG